MTRARGALPLAIASTLAAACAVTPSSEDDSALITAAATKTHGDAGAHADAHVPLNKDAGTLPNVPPSTSGPSYLALGDSIAFGQNPTVANEMDLTQFVGYPMPVASSLGLSLTNAGCSGEASSGFISDTGADNGCREQKAKGRLHTIYTTTQLDFATSFLKAHPDTKLVTLDIGANDLILAKKACDGGVLCEIPKVPEVAVSVGANARTIFKAIRDTGYAGPLVLMTTYVPDYSDLTATIAMSLVNDATKAEVEKSDIHGLVADAYGAMKAAAAGSKGDACAAGLLIPLPQGGCDIHPTPAGRDVLAKAVLAAVGK